MKKYIIILTAILLSGLLQAQTNIDDLEIANRMIAKNKVELIKTLDTLDVEYWVTSKTATTMDIYIQYNNSVRLWQINYGDIIRIIGNREVTVATDVAKEIFVRYRHSNMNDLKHFFLYEKPENTESKVYEKENGDKLSHFRISLR